MIYNSFLFLPPTHPHHPSHHIPRTNNLNPSASTHNITNHQSQPTAQPMTQPTQPTHPHHPSHHKPTTNSLSPPQPTDLNSAQPITQPTIAPSRPIKQPSNPPLLRNTTKPKTTKTHQIRLTNRRTTIKEKEIN